MATKNAKEKRLHLAIIRQLITLATSGFGLVAALAWNNVIQEFVNSYIKKYLAIGGGLLSLLIYAVLITVLAVSITYQLSKFEETMERQLERIKKPRILRKISKK